MAGISTNHALLLEQTFQTGGSPVSAIGVVKLILEIVLVVLSLLLTLLILMHKGKGGGLSDMFGGGLTQNAGSSGVAEKNLNRWTVIIALIWVAIIITLGLFAKFNLS
nr:preprotein translocase subunit SecG [Bifidobacterium choloepi]